MLVLLPNWMEYMGRIKIEWHKNWMTWGSPVFRPWLDARDSSTFTFQPAKATSQGFSSSLSLAGIVGIIRRWLAPRTWIPNDILSPQRLSLPVILWSRQSSCHETHGPPIPDTPVHLTPYPQGAGLIIFRAAGFRRFYYVQQSDSLDDNKDHVLRWQNSATHKAPIALLVNSFDTVTYCCNREKLTRTDPGLTTQKKILI
jgi:hypothetical protein